MKLAAAILWVVAGASCGAKNVAPPSGKTVASPACRDAYADYEARWRTARTEEVAELVVGDTAMLDEILYYELASLPGRVELEKLRTIYAVVDAFLWNTPWPKALASAEVAIERCGEQTARPAS